MEDIPTVEIAPNVQERMRDIARKDIRSEHNVNAHWRLPSKDTFIRGVAMFSDNERVAIVYEHTQHLIGLMSKEIELLNRLAYTVALKAEAERQLKEEDKL